MAGEAENRAAFAVQAGYCAAMTAPVMARVCVALGQALDRESATGRRVLDWAGEPVADAVVLRLVGGMHALHRAGVDADLSRVFDGAVTDEAAVAKVLGRAVRQRDAALLPWLDGPPQTNEAARSGGLMTGLLHLATRFGPRVEVLEIGSSAGLNLMLGRYRFDLGGVGVGPADATVRIVPAWRGVAPPVAAVEVVGARGVDIAPVDVGDPVQAARLEAYVWVDAQERLARLAAAIGEVRRAGVDLVQGDAADWVEARLAEPQAAGGDAGADAFGGVAISAGRGAGADRRGDGGGGRAGKRRAAARLGDDGAEPRSPPPRGARARLARRDGDGAGGADPCAWCVGRGSGAAVRDARLCHAARRV